MPKHPQDKIKVAEKSGNWKFFGVPKSAKWSQNRPEWRFS
jgi:hypothetical protein